MMFCCCKVLGVTGCIGKFSSAIACAHPIGDAEVNCLSTPPGDIPPSGVRYWSKFPTSLPCCNLSLTKGSHQASSPPFGTPGAVSSHLKGKGSKARLTAGTAPLR